MTPTRMTASSVGAEREDSQRAVSESRAIGRSIVVLASASPRRRELLRALGFEVIVKPADVDESERMGESASDYVLRLARAKAERVANLWLAGDLDLARFAPLSRPILAADTTVTIDGQLLGKPKDREDAVSMLQRLSGREHRVLTGVAVRFGEREATCCSDSKVHFRRISPNEAAAYWATGECRDKAGAYGIQGIGGIFAERIEGSFSGIMGLPVFEVDALLRSMGIGVLGVAGA